jgi:hypothetical protein
MWLHGAADGDSAMRQAKAAIGLSDKESAFLEDAAHGERSIGKKINAIVLLSAAQHGSSPKTGKVSKPTAAAIVKAYAEGGLDKALGGGARPDSEAMGLFSDGCEGAPIAAASGSEPFCRLALHSGRMGESHYAASLSFGGDKGAAAEYFHLKKESGPDFMVRLTGMPKLLKKAQDGVKPFVSAFESPIALQDEIEEFFSKPGNPAEQEDGVEPCWRGAIAGKHGGVDDLRGYP